jgi:hypothetical protein
MLNVACGKTKHSRCRRGPPPSQESIVYGVVGFGQIITDTVVCNNHVGQRYLSDASFVTFSTYQAIATFSPSSMRWVGR